MDWTMAQAKKDFDRGLLKEVRIVAATADTWSVQITSSLKHDGTGWLLGAKNKSVRQMRTLDAAIQAAKDIGFEVKTLAVNF